MAETQQVTLRPVTEADLAVLESGPTPDADPWNFFGWSSSGGLRTDFAEHGLLTAEVGFLMVAVSGQAVGYTVWHQAFYGPPATGRSLNVGISLSPEHRGRGYGSEAQRLLADYLLATYPINRIEAATDVENIAEQRALDKAGFSREGVLRGCQFRAGAWHDLVVFSRLRGD